MASMDSGHIGVYPLETHFEIIKQYQNVIKLGFIRSCTWQPARYAIY